MEFNMNGKIGSELKGMGPIENSHLRNFFMQMHKIEFALSQNLHNVPPEAQFELPKLNDVRMLQHSP